MAGSFWDYLQRVVGGGEPELGPRPTPTGRRGDIEIYSKSSPLYNLTDPIKEALLAASREYGIPLRILTRQMFKESGFLPNQVSPRGAAGLMQLMPETQKLYGVTDPYDIQQNTRAGAAYLKKLYDQFDQNWEHALAAYNAGPGRVRRAGGVPKIQETQDYVRYILAPPAAKDRDHVATPGR